MQIDMLSYLCKIILLFLLQASMLNDHVTSIPFFASSCYVSIYQDFYNYSQLPLDRIYKLVTVSVVTLDANIVNFRAKERCGRSVNSDVNLTEWTIRENPDFPEPDPRNRLLDAVLAALSTIRYLFPRGLAESSGSIPLFGQKKGCTLGSASSQNVLLCTICSTAQNCFIQVFFFNNDDDCDR